MSVRCSQCAGTTVWDDDAASAICTSCGTLVDPSQSILTNHMFLPDASHQLNALWDPAAPSTLKACRTNGTNWDLPGQGKEARDRKNNYAIIEFIKSLAVSLNASGLSPRTVTLFHQVKSATHFRWGRKSKLVAGACLAIALRESNRPDSLHDIAFLLDEPSPSPLLRTFASIITLLKLKLSKVDPAVYISSFQGHLASAIGEHQKEINLPPALLKSLKQVCLRSASATATSLCNLVVRLGPDNPVGQLPVPPSACAIFMLALEAENRAVLNNLGELAHFLGSRCHVGKAVVMARYKVIQDEVATWIASFPWLDQYESKNGRAKVSKRLVVARGLKDVLKFQDELWKKHTVRPHVQLDEDDEEITSGHRTERPPKRRKLNRAMEHAARFLLDPLSVPVPTYPKSSNNDPNSRSLPLTSYLVANPSASMRHPPTRLQLLAVDRGAAHITDDELFDDGELEGMLRSEEEIKVLQHALGWDNCEEEEQRNQEKAKQRPSRSRTVGGKKAPKRSRVNMEALARFLSDDQSQDICDDKDADMDTNAMFLLPEDMTVDDFKDDDDEAEEDDDEVTTVGSNTEEILVDEWRPMSPETGISYNNDFYSEEYY